MKRIIICQVLLCFLSLGLFSQNNQDDVKTNVKSVFQKNENGFWHFLNEERQKPFYGIVYQPTKENKHINDYRPKLSSLYSALLPIEKGGKDHAKKLHELGINVIRVYELPIVNKTEIDSIKTIFKYCFEKYHIRVLIGDWAGLYSNINYDRIAIGQILQEKPNMYFISPFFEDEINLEYEKIQRQIEKLVKSYCRENWIFGWQIGNENNYYVSDGMLGENIGLSMGRYYKFMDYFAGELRNALTKEGVQQFVALGQGDISLDEARWIKTMNNIDAVGINCYRNPADSIGMKILSLLLNYLDKPIYFAEFGKSSKDSIVQESIQSEYIIQMAQWLYSQTPGKFGDGYILGGFIHEATDENWKIREHGNTSDGYYGIFEKEAERELKKWIDRQSDFNKTIPINNSPEHLLSTCWELLQGEFAQKHGADYGNSIAFANLLINKYRAKADSQQISLQSGSLPIKVGANDSLWALNSVGTAFFIKGKSNYELASNIFGTGDRDLSKVFYNEAQKDFNYVINNYPYAHLRSANGKHFSIEKTIRKLFPEFSEPYIKNSYKNLLWFVLLPFLLISHFGRFLYLQAGKLIGLLSGRKKQKSKIVDKNVLSIWHKFIFSLLLIAQLYFLFMFIQFWYHPVRYEYYFVSPLLYWTLTIIGASIIIFYLYIWYIIWGMKVPQKMVAKNGNKVAMATTFVAGESIDMLEYTLKKITQVTYPHDTFLLDESNDTKIKKICNKLDINHFSRNGIENFNTSDGKYRKKTKAGNLNSWLETHGDNYEFVVFLDPDHAPLPHFLHSTLGYFQENTVGFVQAPQIFRNTYDNYITKGAAEQSFFFFGPIQMGLYGLGSCMLNGSHTTLRIEAIKKVGEYAVHDADDVLMSIKLRTKGYRGIYIPNIVALGLVPDTWKAFLHQQKRWAASVFNLMTYHYPIQFLKHGWNQVITYYFMGLFYLTGMLFSLLLILPIISIFTNCAIVNVVLFDFLKQFLPYFTIHYLILLLGQFFLINKGSHRGIWFRGGLLWIGSWAHFSMALFSGIFKKRVGDREITEKGGSEKQKSNSKRNDNSYHEFLPHLIIVLLSIIAMIYSQLNPEMVEQTRGMQLFLIINILLQGFIFFLATKKTKVKYSSKKS